MNISQKVIINSALSIGLKILSSILGIFVIYFLTHYLGREGFGKYQTALVYLYILNTIADLGIYGVVLREVKKEQEFFSNALSLRVFSLFLFYIIGFFAMRFFPYDKEIKLGIIIASFSTISASLVQLFLTIYQKRLVAYKISIYEFFSRIFFLALILFLIYLNSSIFYFYLSASLSGLFLLFFVINSSKKYIKISFGFDIKKIYYIFKEALPIGIIIVFVLIYFKLDQLMLSYFKGPEDVGTYALSYKFIENILFIPSSIMALIVPIFSRNLENILNYKKIFSKVLKYFILLSSALILGFFYFSDFIIKIIAPESFKDSGDVLRILSFSLIFIFIGSVCWGVVLTHKKQRYVAWIYVFGAFLNIFLNMIFIPKYSYYGASITTIITEFFVNIAIFLYVIKLLGFKISSKDHFITMTLWTLFLAPYFYFKEYKEIAGVVFGLFYLIFMYVFGIIEKKDLKDVFQIKNIILKK